MGLGSRTAAAGAAVAVLGLESAAEGNNRPL